MFSAVRTSIEQVACRQMDILDDHRLSDFLLGKKDTSCVIGHDRLLSMTIPEILDLKDYLADEDVNLEMATEAIMWAIRKATARQMV